MSLKLQKISLYQFKNYINKDFEFNAQLIGICGKNGVGKTNILDAIHYLCFTKSYFTRQDSMAVHYGHQGFRIEGNFIRNDKTETATCVLRENAKKELALNKEVYSRFSQHIGHFPSVVIAPDDVQLIIGTSEERRKFLDTLLSQFDAAYLQHLIYYNKILQQRNSFLRNYNEAFGSRDLSVLDILDEQLSKEGDEIFKKRRDFLFTFLPAVSELYNEIAQQNEPVFLLYESELQQTTFEELLSVNRQKDLAIMRTSAGVHRDDLLFNFGEQSFRSIASQGQRKSLLFALKLAEMEVLKNEKQMSPLLLLDDVFEKLDEERISNLLVRVSNDEEAQIFITDTNCKRLQEQLEKLGKEFQMIQLE